MFSETPNQSAKEALYYTYEDYLTLPDDFRCEIINGQIYAITLSPTPGHQRVTGQVYGLIWNHLSKNICRSMENMEGWEFTPKTPLSH